MREMMSITHKILVNNETGKILHPAYLINDPRPAPPDCTWVEIQPGDALYLNYCMNPPQNCGNVDLNELVWDFTSGTWIEVLSQSFATYERVKFARNELLKGSDRIFETITDPVEIEAWKLYRQQLRNMFVNLPDDFDWNTIIFPRKPTDIAELKRLAAEGDEEAAAIILRDNL